MNILANILLVLLLMVCALLVTVVLMQRSKSDGLAGGSAFGGGFTEQFFGAGTATVLVKITTWLGGIFFGLALMLAILFSVQHKAAAGTGKLKKIVASTNAVSKASHRAGTNASHAPGATNSASSSSSTNAPTQAK